MDKETEKRLKALEKQMKSLESFSTIAFNVEKAFKERLGINPLKTELDRIPDELGNNAPITAITAPSGGVTVDSQARTAINSIITALETLGLLTPN